ncbi:hypothetical protein CLU79DRAFT_767248 [Phycomyces nitens]|nr:hypothetical protein CLU79DRAFT_767248 [Phycomyces nitens]
MTFFLFRSLVLMTMPHCLLCTRILTFNFSSCQDKMPRATSTCYWWLELLYLYIFGFYRMNMSINRSGIGMMIGQYNDQGSALYICIYQYIYINMSALAAIHYSRLLIFTHMMLVLMMVLFNIHFTIF